MPLPTPNKGEGSQAFVSRCMGSDVMQKEFPTQKQRSAVCYSQLRRSRGRKTLMEKKG